MSDQTPVAGPRRRLPRTRGATGGVLLVVLGVWGGLAPFIGPYYNFGFTPDDAWKWTAARGWLEVVPGAITLVGGILLVVSASRATTVGGSVLGIIGGTWFVIGTPLAGPLRLGSPGRPLGTNQTQQSLETLALFFGLGALVIIIAASAFGRLSVVTVRDVDAAARREQAVAAEQAATAQDAAAFEAVHRDGEVRRQGDVEPAHTPEHAHRAGVPDQRPASEFVERESVPQQAGPSGQPTQQPGPAYPPPPPPPPPPADGGSDAVRLPPPGQPPPPGSLPPGAARDPSQP